MGVRLRSAFLAAVVLTVGRVHALPPTDDEGSRRIDRSVRRVASRRLLVPERLGDGADRPAVPSREHRRQKMAQLEQRRRLVQEQDRRRDAESRIVGGTPARKGQFPFFSHMAMGCGASLITRDLLLTAGHCADGFETRGLAVIVSALQGWAWEHELSSDIVRYIDEVFVHPMYEVVNYNDVMLVKLSSPVPEGVPTVRLNSDPLVPYVGQPLTVVGMGAVSEDGDDSDTLLEVEVNMVDTDWCNEPERYFGDVHGPTELCAISLVDGTPRAGRDSCYGDSGGPIFIEDDPVRPLQVGIVSRGAYCGSPVYPGVYARVDAFFDWIKTTTCGVSQVDSELCGDIGVPVPASPCGENEVEMTFRLRTDIWSAETSWRLSDADGNTIDQAAAKTLLEDTTYNIRNCLPRDTCYTLLLEDDQGDGMVFDAQYEVLIDGSRVFINSNPAYRYTMRHDFCVGTDGSHSGGEGVADAVEGGGGDGDGSCIRIKAAIRTDKRPRQTKMLMFDAFDFSGEHVWDQRGFPEKRTNHVFEACLPRDRCTYLDIIDRKGLDEDGLVTVTVEGQVVYSGRLENWIEQFNVGRCDGWFE